MFRLFFIKGGLVLLALLFFVPSLQAEPWPGGCTQIIKSANVDAIETGCFPRAASGCVDKFYTLFNGVDEATGLFNPMTSHMVPYCQDDCPYIVAYTNVPVNSNLYTFYFDRDSSSWVGPVDTFEIRYYGMVWEQSTISNFQSYPGTLPEGCPVDCTDEKQQKIEECGGEVYILDWDSETCTGGCVPCGPEYDAKLAECGSPGIDTFDMYECYGKCNCNPELIASAEELCSTRGGLSSFDQELCIPICNNCIGKEPECENGIYSYDMDTCELVCKTCLTMSKTCPFDCEFLCDDLAGSPAINYTCECQPDPDPDPIPDPDPDPLPEPVDDPIDDPATDPQPDPEPDPEPVDDPVNDPDDLSNGWLKAIKKDTDILVNQGNETNNSLDLLNENLATVVDNQGAIESDLDNIESNTRDTADSLNEIENDTGSIRKILTAIYNLLTGGITVEGDASLPNDNIYDGEIKPEDQPEETSLLTSFNAYLTNGLPLVSYIKGTSIQVNSVQHVFEFNAWGYTIIVDFADYEDILDAAGLILLSLSVIASFMIVVGRGK